MAPSGARIGQNTVADQSQPATDGRQIGKAQEKPALDSKALAEAMENTIASIEAEIGPRSARGVSRPSALATDDSLPWAERQDLEDHEQEG